MNNYDMKRLKMKLRGKISEKRHERNRLANEWEKMLLW